MAGGGEGIGDRNGEPPRHMVVAGPRQAQRRIARADGMMTSRPCGGYHHKRVNRFRHLRPGEAVVAVPALPFAGDQPGIGELGEMTAGGLWRDPGMAREFSSGQRLAAHQGSEEVRPRRLADKASDGGDGVPGSDAGHRRSLTGRVVLVSHRRFGRGRTIAGLATARDQIDGTRECWSRIMAGSTNLARELALLALLSTVWGASYTFIRVAVTTIPPVTLIAARTFVAGLILVGVMYSHGLRFPPLGPVWLRFLVQASLNSVVPFTLIAWAEQTIGAGLATILNATTPVFAFLVTAIVTRHETVSRRKLFGVAAGLLGTCLIVGFEALSGLGEETWAQLGVVVATVCYAGAAIFGRRFGDFDPTVAATGSLVCGALVLAPVSIVVDRPWTLAPSAASLVALLALATISTALAFVIYFRLLQTLGSVGITAQSYLRVPIGVTLGVVLLGERLTPTAWLGLGCVVVGVIAMTIPPGESGVGSPRRISP
jgi:drug/metabolite transporter (DMT)-like permease